MSPINEDYRIQGPVNTYDLNRLGNESINETANDNQIIEKNVELINKGTTETITEQQELHTELVNVDTVRLLDALP